MGPRTAFSKVGDYRKEKGAGEWPYAQFVTDVLRASFIVANSWFRVYEQLDASPDSDIVRLKNKIGLNQEPFNLCT